MKYKIPEITIKKKKKRDAIKGDPWIKGFRSEEGYKEFVSRNEIAKEELDLVLTTEACKDFDELISEVKSYYDSSNIFMIPEVEKAFVIKSSRIEKTLDLKRIFRKIYTPEQKLKIEILKTKLEIAKQELKLKNIEIKDKEIELELTEKKAEYYLK